MKFTLSWLKDHLDTDADAETIAAKLTAIGLQVEAIEDAGARLRDFVVAHVISAEKHPNADKLKLCVVDAGTGERIQVVCGAPNAHTGMKGVFARPGVVIPYSGDVLKVGTIRGIESRGMLCSGRELLLSEDHEGIIELSDDAVVGAPAASALGLNDPVIDVGLTPNRGDAASVFGIARDLAAASHGRLKDGAVKSVASTSQSPISVSLEFTPEDASACPLFAGRFIRNVKNGPSPKWVQDRLKAIGLRPISALVDVTNLITYDRGRPLHVFDADLVQGNIGARLARAGESVAALDGRTYQLDPAMCVIADDKRALGIAGIIGGKETGCSETTRNVFIESAYFDPVRTARTGMRLDIISDARYRFERGVDPEFVVPGIELATKLILEWCGGEPSKVVVAGKVPEWRRIIAFDPGLVGKIAGVTVEPRESRAILERLGFKIDGDRPMRVTPPSWRSDVEGGVDLVEEVVRIRGIDAIPSTPMPRANWVAKPALTLRQRRAQTTRRLLASRGFNETVNFTFIPRAHARLFGGGDEAREVANPISADLDAMRPSLIPSLLAAAERNAARGFQDLMLFEIGAQFETGVPGGQTDVAAAIRAGSAPGSWTKSQHQPDAFDTKADMLAVIENAMGAPMTAPVKPGAASWYHPGRSGTLSLGPKVLAWFGELHPRVLAAFDLKESVAAFEVFLDAIPEPKIKSKARAPFVASPYQASTRDFAFVLDAKIPADEVIKAAKATERSMIDAIEVFDLYEGKGIPEGKKSLAISVRIQPKDRTLTDAELDAIGAKIVAAVTKATGGELRT
jgi:phenylalanyl-tRNA synthetase beta chain